MFSFSSVASNASSVDPTRDPGKWQPFPATAFVRTCNSRGKENAHMFVKELGNNNEKGRRYALDGQYYRCMMCKKNRLRSKRAILKDGNVYVLIDHRCDVVEMKPEERNAFINQPGRNSPVDDDPMDIADNHNAPNDQVGQAAAPILQPVPQVYTQDEIFNGAFVKENPFELEKCTKIVFESVKICIDTDGSRKYKEMAERIQSKMNKKFGGSWFCGASGQKFHLSEAWRDNWSNYVEVTLADLYVYIGRRHVQGN
uniref:Uncharacterized protein n=1 Tax=Panagrolaimus davidi TaxID=227884 RepID=A0A914PB24_9BILA